MAGCDFILPSLAKRSINYCNLDLTEYQTIAPIAYFDYVNLNLEQYRIVNPLASFDYCNLDLSQYRS